jgi:dolichol-phosphate mannosyltransferase
VIVFMDADGSHDAQDIVRIAGPVVAGEADLCVGSRFQGGSEELAINVSQLFRSIGNISMNIAINRRFHVQLSDTLNGFRAIRREVGLALGLVENRHTIEQEMVIRALRLGYRVTNVPVHEYARRHGVSHIRIWREWPYFVWCLVRRLYW